MYTFIKEIGIGLRKKQLYLFFLDNLRVYVESGLYLDWCPTR